MAMTPNNPQKLICHKTKKLNKNKLSLQQKHTGNSDHTHTHTLSLSHSRSNIHTTANWLKSQNGTLFSHVWRRGRLALDPLQNKSCSEFFSEAYKNWHITWGNNLGPDWPPLARGSKFHTITHPPGRFLPSPRQWKIMSL